MSVKTYALTHEWTWHQPLCDLHADARPDLLLHGFGLKTTALACGAVRDLLHTADSMAWSFAARREGRGPAANDWREARMWLDRLEEVSREVAA